MQPILKLAILAFAIISLNACDGISENEYDNLISQNKRLTEQLEQCQFGPQKLLDEAKALAENNELDDAAAKLQTLIAKHPGTPESKAAANSLVGVNEKIELAAAARKDMLAQQEKEKSLRIAKATKQMRSHRDEVRGITFFQDRSSPRYVNQNGFFAQIGKNDEGQIWMRLKVQYYADDWLFIEKYIIKADESTYVISEAEYGEISSDHQGGRIWEWLDRHVGPPELEIINAVAKCKAGTIRFVGKDYVKDKEITSRQKRAFQNVLDAYEALK